MERPRLVGYVALPEERTRHIIQAATDPLIAMGAVVVALWMRFETAMPSENVSQLWWVLPFVGVVQLLAGWSQGLYRGRWRFGGFEEVLALARAVSLTSLALLAASLLASDRPVPVAACVAQGFITLLVASSFRWSWRLVLERSMRPTGEDLTRVVIVGAGEAGGQLVRSMMRNPDGPYLPVGLVDDDPMKRSLRLQGVPVLGTSSQVCDVATRVEADTVVIALPSADGAVIRDIAGRAGACGLHVLVLPPVNELLGGQIASSDVRPLTESDLLGRRRIETDLDAIAGYVTGARVLVTGAGGSIGSELCRQIYRFAPAELVMLDRDESLLHEVQMSIEGRAMLDSRNLVVADIREADRMAEVFDEHRPQVVFHAAALKHLPLLEMHPREAVKSNCRGTQNMLDQALRHDVGLFVNISTDKAADPTSVLGCSKRVAERLTAHAAGQSKGSFVSVRFGNVLGSRGSVLTAFRTQIEAGGPVTVTHPDVTRYFMTVEEAVELVIQAGAIGRDGEAMVLDMGEPVRIAEVARRLVEQSERTVDIVYTGLRPGEKMHEVLLSAAEEPQPSAHELISRVCVEPLEPGVLADLESGPTSEVADALRQVAAVPAHDHTDAPGRP
ncbi:polysaccharide biosynthesis protein [Iamia sp. SCSIO 61187]|uniref:polysaccharide biosynthesis protein n=1 Tax=Iamia sp. SCSIO 61187 TaxID=2722752 RepID=UPI001C62C3FE|nr:nucleoside-diphosphate sugar epimerase/dehydratase [Iamia sp. SCSIO 61187]QYG92359.1 polysaccharide biosynthesis protein [Iamia sp. SCSIO 61187]